MSSFILLGSFSLLAQVFVLEDLYGLLTGHEAAIGLGLSAWLAWTAAGMALALRSGLAEKLEGGRGFFSACALFTAAAAANLLLLRKAGVLIAPGLPPGLLQLIAFSFLLPMPAALANGICLARGLTERRLPFYRAEALGAAAAGVLTWSRSLYFPGLDPLFICGAAAAALLSSVRGIPLSDARKAVPSVLVPLVFFAGQRFLPPFAVPSSYKDASAYARTAGSRLLMTARGDEKTFVENGSVLAQVPLSGQAELSAQLPLLAHERPGNVLLTGPSALFLVREAEKHAPDAITAADPDSFRTAFIKAHAGLKTGSARIEASDPRALLEKSEASYDLIIQTVQAPLNAASNRFFTLEFFREAAAALKKGGILAFTLPFSENYLPPERAYLAASVLASASAVFKHMELVPGGTLTVLLSDGPIDLAPGTLARRYADRRPGNTLVVPENLPFILDQYRKQWALAALGRIKTPPPNTDLEPAAYFYLWRMWLAMFVSPGTLTGLALLAVVLTLLAGRLLRPGELLRDRKAAGIFLAGAWAMGFEIICLFLFQNFSGQLSWKLGALFAGFMCGTAAGAALFASASPAAGRRAAALLALGLTAGLWYFVPGIAGLPRQLLFPLFLGLIFSAGTALGGYFAAASASGGAGTAVRLYYSDLLGAALGGFVVSAALIPLAGLRVSLLAAAAAAALSLL